MKTNRAQRTLNEIIMEACEEIEFQYDEGVTELIETALFHNHGIKLEEIEVVTYKLVDKFVEEVEAWAEATNESYF